ncbi:unnamed protein product [Rotaria magnacalcarata]|uniref:G-protein coupled receptors family 1 profile domain-containing protein n=3 Tax=Rotaria magnacalcarata TaxID=392030 RepID=A0A816PNJ2_9BILA|nr:unnamed protein product [Rotaria magnacalcarata]
MQSCPPPSCLDWREICDGIVDCLDGIDELDCLELEINECDEHEYRCHQGMCVPEQFINDNPCNPDCLDSSDEDDYSQEVATPDKYIPDFYTNGVEYPDCYQDPSFRCEESNHRLKIFLLNSVCGDGQPSIAHLAHKGGRILNNFKDQYVCQNKRIQMLEASLASHAGNSNLSYECWYAMMCIAYMTDEDYDSECDALLEEMDDEGRMSLENRCNRSDHVIFPVHPILEGHVRFGYWTRKSFKIKNRELSKHPDFVCYDAQRCSFLPFTMKIDNLTCIEVGESFKLIYSTLPALIHTCDHIYESGNETDCFHPALFHCPGTSKCISKHRLLDGNPDCYNDTDELYENSCQLNDQHRFRCTLENKCISRYIVRDGISHCLENQDEIPISKQQEISFQKLCNGYTSLSSIVNNGINETDETNCEQWPCNNQYTRCDGAWTCSNGADEIGCDQSSICYPDSHECISPTSFDIICLPIDRAGDGVIDCLGATDEREYCRKRFPEEILYRYRCSNDTKCSFWRNSLHSQCVDTAGCEAEKDFSFNIYSLEEWFFGRNCTTHVKMISVLNKLLGDQRLINNDNFNEIHFTLDHANQLSSNINQPSLSILNQSSIRSKKLNFIHNSICHRGILIELGKEKIESCLCPPSYYGKQCQFQSQRISLTLKIGKECAPNCRGVYGVVLALIDHQKIIHSYEQLTYITTINCDLKYNLYFLYGSRPKDLTKNYSIHIDIYDRVDLSYYMSWTIPVRLVFLPVNRISVHMIIPSHPMHPIEQCPLVCGHHGQCRRYINTAEYFCHCSSGWSGIRCTVHQNKCDCSSSSICIGIANNRSICLCPLDKFGPRCFIPSVCSDRPCKNNGQCVPKDDRLSIKEFFCICPEGYFGNTCEMKNRRIHISFHSIEIPRILFAYLITVQTKADPLITIISKKISLDQDSVTLFMSIHFNMILLQIQSNYYLSFLPVNATQASDIEIELKPIHYCAPIDKLLDKQTNSFSLLHRVKFYHVPCKTQSLLICFHDYEAFMCLCNKDRHANCFPFHFNKNSTCTGRGQCENEGQCISDRSTCPTSIICICAECYYGTKCQFTTEGSSLSLDIILGYQIRPDIPILDQRIAVKITFASTILLAFISYVSSTLSILTFRSKSVRQVGCGFYMLALSVVSLFTATVFTLKLCLLIAFQTLSITNRTAEKINCISIEFILQSLVVIENWLATCISIERALLVTRYDNSTKQNTIKIARLAIPGIILCTLISFMHDPFYRELVNDEYEHRTWCVIRYSPSAKIYDSALQIFHYVVPFFINCISAHIIIINVARTHSAARKNKTRKQHLREQLSEHKHLIISPLILIALAMPHLIISFLTKCIKSIRNPWLFLCAYFVTFIPSLLLSLIFILPSKTYRDLFVKTSRQYLLCK